MHKDLLVAENRNSSSLDPR